MNGQRILATSDGVSGASVKDLVKRLNADIFQTAATISKSLNVKPAVVESRDEGIKEALTRYVRVVALTYSQSALL
ncbi:hypothetical protein CPB85DRAFT_840750 [Mucidula mucida]|nr:hypothetical protein CPB85DRAFT_840750 [Mucidula mucida]